MTNPTDTGGENPTIRDVRPPADTQPATGVTYPDSRLEALLAVLLVEDIPGIAILFLWQARGMRTVTGLLLAAALVASGCGGGGSDPLDTAAPTTTVASTTTAPPTTTPTTATPTTTSVANFSVRDFSVTDLTGADFAGADLEGASFYVAILEGADFSGANLAGADFLRANLEGANLAGANLEGANLDWAILWGTDLTGANMAEARLHEATADTDTRWPDGFDPVAAGVTFTTTVAARLVPNPVFEACVTAILGEGYDDGSRGAHQGDDPVLTAEERDALMLAHTSATLACTLEMVQDDDTVMAAAAAFRSCMLTQLDAFGITADVHPLLPQLITPWKDLSPGRTLQWDDLFGPCDALRTDYSSLTAAVFYVEASGL